MPVAAAMVAPVMAVMMMVTAAEADTTDVAQLLHERVARGVGVHRGGCHGGTTGKHENCKGNKQHFHGRRLLKGSSWRAEAVRVSINYSRLSSGRHPAVLLSQEESPSYRPITT